MSNSVQWIAGGERSRLLPKLELYSVTESKPSLECIPDPLQLSRLRDAYRQAPNQEKERYEQRWQDSLIKIIQDQEIAFPTRIRSLKTFLDDLLPYTQIGAASAAFHCGMILVEGGPANRLREFDKIDPSEQEFAQQVLQKAFNDEIEKAAAFSRCECPREAFCSDEQYDLHVMRTCEIIRLNKEMQVVTQLDKLALLLNYRSVIQKVTWQPFSITLVNTIQTLKESEHS